MWKIIHELASPPYFYKYSSLWLPWLTCSCIIFLSIGIIWGLVFAPADYQQSDAFRIIYVHVPCAFLSMALFASMGCLAMLVLVWKIKLAGVLINTVAHIGVYMTLLALLTGSIWGKPMWGTWWVWDARLTAELILLFMYAAIIALGQAYPHAEQGDKMMAMLSLVGLADLPVIHYSVYWWQTLHQGATITVFSPPKIALSMLYPLLCTACGFLLYCVLIIVLRARNERLWRERRQQWVAVVLGITICTARSI